MRVGGRRARTADNFPDMSLPSSTLADLTLVMAENHVMEMNPTVSANSLNKLARACMRDMTCPPTRLIQQQVLRFNTIRRRLLQLRDEEPRNVWVEALVVAAHTRPSIVE